ncbi:sodium:alanine symporter family protein [Skermanella mucosa]|uniref:alanine/glycine:cation symporter family protein n=1 Tax=Skermanella mucosa TaxID=1789672 RepID=UPI00192BC271|nr:sodium:alanine symporter family protein [Skermanella mucosa]UEM19999.1 sodium:alanine symporter family protein [Skermanella mucosa]
MESVDAVLGALNTVIWGYVLIYVLIGAGIYFTVKTRFLQFRRFGHLFGVMSGSRHCEGGGISPFQAFCVSMASRVGTGNIAGVAIALTLGGPGAVFWMWCVALVGMATAFVEATLAQLYKVPQPDGTFRGGPAYYIQRGLGSRTWGIVFAVLLIFTFGLAFNAVQANTIADVLGESFGVPTWVTGVALALICAPIFFGGIRSVARVAEWMLPVMALAYVALALLILVIHIDRVPDMFMLIVRSAFGLDQAAAGAFGGLTVALMNGAKRGLFSNEAGMGSAPNMAATATTTHPATQGFIQALGVFVDTIVICSATAFIILLSDQYDVTGATEMAGASLTQSVIAEEFGTAGGLFMTFVIFLFAFSSIIGNYAYADGNMTFLGARISSFNIFRIVAVLAVLGGSIGELPTVWALADVAMGLMALVNLGAILMLSKWAFATLADYEASEERGLPRFEASGNALMPGALKTEVW